MAHNNIEIEIKFEINEKKASTVIKSLEEIAEYKYDLHQTDRYFNAPHRNFLEPKWAYEYLRIREEGGTTKVTYKHMYPEEAKDKTHADEYEFDVSSADQVEKMFSALNFEEYLVIDKKRRTFVYDNHLEIVVDEVKDLGFFIEIETVSEFKSVEDARKAIFDFAKKLGITKDDQHFGGYVLAMLKAKGLR